MASSSHAVSATLLRILTSRLGLCIVCLFFAQWTGVQAQCNPMPCSLTVAIYSVQPFTDFGPTSTSKPTHDTPTHSTTPSSTLTSSTKSSSSILSSTQSSTPSSTPSNTQSSKPSTAPSITPSSTSASTPASTPSSTAPKVAESDKSAGTSPNTAASNTPLKIQSSYALSNATNGPITTSLPLPKFKSSSAPVLPSITIGPSFNSSSTNGTNSTTSTQCGQCSVMAQQVQVYYWPTASVKSNCARASSVPPFQSGLTYAANATTNAIRSRNSLVGDGSIDVVNGFTYTYPSTYVSVVGEISVSNSCGVLGKTYTNPTPVAVAAITTASYASWPSDCRPQGSQVDVVIDTLDIADIACPTWGLSNPFYTTCDGEVYITATEGEPYNPVILVPTEFLNYDPTWGSCTQVPINGPFFLPCGVYDPPRALHTEGSLGPATTPASDPPTTTPPPAEPVVAPSPNLPQPTTPPVQLPQTIQAPVPQPVQPQQPNSGPSAAPAPAHGGTNGSPSDPNQNPAPLQGTTNDPQDDPSQTSTPNTSGQGSNNQPAGPQTPPLSDPQEAAPELQPVPQTTINLNGGQPSPALGVVIYSALGAGSSSPQQTAQGSGSQGANSGTGSEGSTGGSAGGSTEGNPLGGSGGSSGGNSGGSSGGSPDRSSGGTAGGSEGGSQGGNAQPNVPAAAFTPHTITALGRMIAVTNPSAIAIAGSTLSAGGPGITSGGTYYSLAPSGNLIAGTVTNAPAAAPVLTFAGSTYTANAASQFVVAGQTLNPGQQITVAGTPISLAPAGSSNVAVIDSSTQSLAMVTPAPAGAALLTFGGSTYTANTASQFVIAGQTLNPGQQITVSGTPISLGPSGSANIAVIGSSTQSLSMITSAPFQSPALLTFDGSTYTANSASQFVIAGQTLTQGGQITVSGTPISLAPLGSSNVAVIGGSTQALQSATLALGPALLTFDGTTYTANSASQFIIAGKTLTPGGEITIFGMPISEGAGGAFAVIGTSTQSLMMPSMTNAPALLTFNGVTYTANPASDFVIAGQTLTPGGQITVSGTPISEAASGSGLVVVGSSTQVLGHASVMVTSAAVMTFGGQTYTANLASDFIIDGQTLTPGGMITVSGTPISEAAGATDVVIGTSTEMLSTAAITSKVIPFEGGQTKVSVPCLGWLFWWLGLALISGIFFLA